MTFQLTIRGGTDVQYRIVEKEAFRIVGIMRRVRLQITRASAPRSPPCGRTWVWTGLSSS